MTDATTHRLSISSIPNKCSTFAMGSRGPMLPNRRPAPGAYDLFPQESVSSWLDGLQAKIRAGLSGEEPANPDRPSSPLRAYSPGTVDDPERDTTANGYASEAYNPSDQVITRPSAEVSDGTAAPGVGPWAVAELNGDGCFEGQAGGDDMVTDEDSAVDRRSTGVSASPTYVIELGDSEEGDNEGADSCDLRAAGNLEQLSEKSGEDTLPYQRQNESHSTYNSYASEASEHDLGQVDSSGSESEGSEADPGSAEDSTQTHETEEEDDELETEGEEDGERGTPETISKLPAHGSETQPIDLLDSDDEEAEEDSSDSETESHPDSGEDNPYPTPPLLDPEQSSAPGPSTLDLSDPNVLAAEPTYSAQIPEPSQWALPDIFATPPSAAMLGAVLHNLSQNVLQEPPAEAFAHGYPDNPQAPPIDPELLDVQSQQAGSVLEVFAEGSHVRDLHADVEETVAEGESGLQHHRNDDFCGSHELSMRSLPVTDTFGEHLVADAPLEPESGDENGLQDSSIYHPPGFEADATSAEAEGAMTGLISGLSRDADTVPTCGLPVNSYSPSVRNQAGTTQPVTTIGSELVLHVFEEPRPPPCGGVGTEERECTGPDPRQSPAQVSDGGTIPSGALSETMGPVNSLTPGEASGGSKEHGRVEGAADAKYQTAMVERLGIMPKEGYSKVDHAQESEEWSQDDGSDDDAATPELVVFDGDATSRTGSPSPETGLSRGPSAKLPETQTEPQAQAVEPQMSLLSESDEEVPAAVSPTSGPVESVIQVATVPFILNQIDTAPSGSRNLSPNVQDATQPHTAGGQSGPGSPIFQTLPSLPPLQLEKDVSDEQGLGQSEGLPCSAATATDTSDVQNQSCEDRSPAGLGCEDDSDDVGSPHGRALSSDQHSVHGAAGETCKSPSEPLLLDSCVPDGNYENHLHSATGPSSLPERHNVVSDGDAGGVLEPANDGVGAAAATESHPKSLNPTDTDTGSTDESEPTKPPPSESPPLHCEGQTSPGESGEVIEERGAQEIRSSRRPTPDMAESQGRPSDVLEVREGTPEYRPLRHHHGRGRTNATPSPALRLPRHPSHQADRSSPVPIEPPVTRSNCGYLKLHLVEGEYSATVLVPQCTLGDAERLEEESAAQLGMPTLAEERWAQNNMPPVRQLHPALHSKLSRITGPTMLQSYSTEMSPARDRTTFADSERWHVFILEASEGAIEYERNMRRPSVRPPIQRTPEPNRDRENGPLSTPGSRRKRSLSAVTEDGVHLSTGRKSAQAKDAVEASASPLRRSSRLRSTSQALSEASDAPALSPSAPGPMNRRVTRAMKALEASGTSSLGAPSATDGDAAPTGLSVGADELSREPQCKLGASTSPVGTRQRKRKLENLADGDQDGNSGNSTEREHREAPKRGFGWSIRRWFGR